MLVTHEVPLQLMHSNLEKEINGNLFYALVHLFEDNPEYYKYTVNALHTGRQVILDNSAYELHGKPFDANAFAAWINKLAEHTSVDIVNSQLTYIIPDVFDDVEATWNYTSTFLQDHPDLPGKAMSVLQGQNFVELYNIFRYYLSEPRIKKIGVNFMSAAYTNFVDSGVLHANGLNPWAKRMHGRRAFIETLYHLGYLGKKPLHLLGAALPGEFVYYTKDHPVLSTFIESMDTSAPIVCGMFGEIYDEANQLSGLKRPEKLAEHLTDSLTKEQIHNIIWNVNVFKKYNNL